MSKLPLKQQLDAIDKKKRGWYSSLSDDEQKQISPWVLMRYISSSDSVNQLNEYFLEMVNSIVNVQFNTLRHHPELQIQLLQAIGLGRSMYHPWIAPGKRGEQSKLNTIISNLYPNLNDEEVGLLIKNSTPEELSDTLDQLGYDKKEIKKILK